MKLLRSILTGSLVAFGLFSSVTAMAQISVDPMMISEELMEGDSVQRTLTIMNGGPEPVDVTLQVTQNELPGSHLIAVTGSSYNSENLALESTLTELGYPFVYVETVSEAELAGADAILARFGGTVLSLEDVNTWIASGKGYVQIGDWANWFANDHTSTVGSPVQMISNFPEHPLFEGVAGSWSAEGYWHYTGGGSLGWATDPDLVDYASGTLGGDNYPRVITSRHVGLGYGVYIGVNVYGPDAGSNAVTLFGNALEWVTSGAYIDWLSLSASMVEVPAGGEESVQITLDAEFTGSGQYLAEIQLDDGYGGLVQVPVALEVNGTPVITATPAFLDFGSVYTGQHYTGEIVIANEGTDVLTVSSITIAHPDFSVDQPMLILPAGVSATLTISYDPMSTGYQHVNMVLTSDDPATPVLYAGLSGDAYDPPVLVSDHETVYQELDLESTAQQTITIENAGGSGLSVDAWVSGASLIPESLSAPEVQNARSVTRTDALSGPAQGLQAAPQLKNHLHNQRGLLIAVTISNYNLENVQLQNTLTDLGYDYVWVNSVEEAVAAGAHAILGRFGGTILDAAELDSWMMNGGGYLQLADWTEWYPTNWISGLGDVEVTITDPAHPLATDLPVSWQAQGYFHYSEGDWLAQVTSPVYHEIGAAAGYERVITADMYENGYTAFIGFNVYGEDADANSLQLFSNALQWVTTGSVVNWLQVTPNHLELAAGATGTIDAMFSSVGLPMGQYEADIVLSHNIPDEEPVLIPVTLVVDDYPYDPCLDMTPLDCDSQVAGNTGDFSDESAFNGYTGVGGGYTGPERIFRVDLAEVSTLNFILTTAADLDLILLSDCDPTMVLFSGDDELVTDCLDPGSYYLVVDGPVAGDFMVDLYCGGCTTDLVAVDFALEANYPNPFNPETMIRYSLSEPGPVSLRIFDTSGRVVSELVNENQAMGQHQVLFDGSELASGIYFYQLTAGEQRAVRKMTLIK